jgi:hypothetical protein
MSLSGATVLLRVAPFQSCLQKDREYGCSFLAAKRALIRMVATGSTCVYQVVAFCF